MVPSQTFPGFEDRDRKAGIIILELPPGSYDEGLKAIFSEKPADQVMIEKREMFAFDNGVGFLALGSEQGNGTLHRKWFLLVYNGDLTVLVTVLVPDAASHTYPDAAIRAALKTLTFRANPIEEQLGLLPFQMSDLAGFRVMRVLPQATALLVEGPDANDFVGQPRIIVSAAPGGPQQPSDRDLFAQRLLATLPGFRTMRIVGSEPIRIGGQQGHEIRAEATDNQSGADLRLVQWLRFGPGAYLHMVAVSRAEAWPALFPRFRALRDGIELR
jgi:hypothetical protein